MPTLAANFCGEASSRRKNTQSRYQPEILQTWWSLTDWGSQSLRSSWNYSLPNRRSQFDLGLEGRSREGEAEVGRAARAGACMHFRKMHFRKMHFRKMHFRKMHFRKMHFRKMHFSNMHFSKMHFSKMHFAKILQIFGGLVLGCIKTKFCKKICVWQQFSSSTRFASICTAAIAKFSQKIDLKNRQFLWKFSKKNCKCRRICKILPNFKNFS